ncbi:carboxylesterase family protein [Streptomyces sp. NPDC056716]|uniref:carboxylesterase family protein n=1 Tax=unclassified Streptomyces TaxID=2593676 RepID=UPI0036BBE62E
MLQGNERRGVRRFRGVPYAALPVGELRWASPQPPAPWQGVRDAAGFGPAATAGRPAPTESRPVPTAGRPAPPTPAGSARPPPWRT